MIALQLVQYMLLYYDVVCTMDSSVAGSQGLLIVGKSHQGDRPYMEDYIFVTADKEDYFMAVYDGHGGYEAAQYTYENLWETIKVQDGFYDYQSKTVSNAITNGFTATHESMWKVRGVFTLSALLV